MAHPAALIFLLALGSGCSKSAEQMAPPPPPVAAAATPPTGATVVTVPRNAQDLIPRVKQAMQTAAASNRHLIVYVGADWCEPCQRFHKAVAAGELDATFPTLTLLEFDHDAHKEPLKDAGYVDSLIPLFAVPAADGSSSGRHVAGAVKGGGAVANIVPRLKTLLAE